MTTRICSVIALMLSAACAQPPEADLQLQLPRKLTEISGLALLPDGRLLAVADEKARVYAIDVAARDVDKYAQFGKPAANGDFEGIAILQDNLFLVTSDGRLWRQALDAPGGDYDVVDTGLGKRCEIEGLTAWPARNVLLVLCKSPRDKSLNGKLAVFAWSAAAGARVPALDIVRSFADYGLKRLAPSGLSFTADREGLFIVAARQAAFLQIRTNGDLIRAGKLPAHGGHRQTEGVVITEQNTLYLADEGGKGRGTLTRYDRPI